MSSRSRRRERRPATLSAAGLMSFFEEEIKGIKVRPEIVVGAAIVLMSLVIMAHLGLFSF